MKVLDKCSTCGNYGSVYCIDFPCSRWICGACRYELKGVDQDDPKPIKELNMNSRIISEGKIDWNVPDETKDVVKDLKFEVEVFDDSDDRGWCVQLKSEAIVCANENEAFNVWRELHEQYKIRN